MFYNIERMFIIAEKEKLREVSPLLKTYPHQILVIYITIILLRRFYLPQGDNTMKKSPQLSLISLAVISTFAQAEEIQKLDEIQVTAEQQVKQSLGVSVVTEKDLERNPIENDASEVIAKKTL